jgi:hypothetical protein
MKKLNLKEEKQMKVTFCKTKAGNGFKIAIDDTWLYVSKEYLHAVIDGEATSCQFKTMENSDSTKNESEDSEEDSSNDESSFILVFPLLIGKWE